MDSFKIRPTSAEAPSDEERPKIRDKLWMLAVVALVFGLTVLVNRRRE